VKLYLRHLEGGGGGKKINPGLFPLCLSFAHSFIHSFLSVLHDMSGRWIRSGMTIFVGWFLWVGWLVGYGPF